MEKQIINLVRRAAAVLGIERVQALLSESERATFMALMEGSSAVSSANRDQAINAALLALNELLEENLDPSTSQVAALERALADKEDQLKLRAAAVKYRRKNRDDWPLKLAKKLAKRVKKFGKKELTVRTGKVQPRTQIPIACILDDFSFQNFEPEAALYKLDPKQWKEQLQERRPEFLFVESAWAGNDGAWRYLVTYKEARPSNPLFALLEYCKQEGIPTVFWNKEDPPNFDQFIDAAQRFDYVFTTDANCVSRYRELAPQCKIDVLPFAAQPASQNPKGSTQLEKWGDICFAGAWYPRHPERFEDLQLLLSASTGYQLDIYDRYYNHPQGENYRFPEQYQEFIRGSLSFEEMTAAYRRYRLFLNVNSVKDSPSMFSRRVLEIIASGTPVVSGYAQGIEEMLGSDIVPMVRNQEEANETVARLMGDESARARLVLRGQRKIFREHTYRQRFEKICRAVGLVTDERLPKVSCITATIRPGFVDHFLQNFDRQTYPEKELIVVINEGKELTEAFVKERVEALGVNNVRVIVCPNETTLGSCLNVGVRDAAGSLFAKMDDDDYYGEHFLEDSIHALDYSGADCVGKEAYFTFVEGRDAMYLQYPGREHAFTQFAIGPTFVAKRSIFPEVSFGNSRVGEDSEFLRRLHRANRKLYAHDAYNYIKLYSSDTAHHTWRIQEQSYLNTAKKHSEGWDPDQVCF